MLGLIVATSLLAGTSALAGDLTVIEGRVVDVKGDVVAGATITVRAERSSRSRTAVTNRSGWYRVINLPPGKYTIQARLHGFAPAESTNVEVKSGQTLRHDFRLEPAKIVESIEVRHTRPPLPDARHATVGTALSSEAIESVPLNGRGALDLVHLTAGAQLPPHEMSDLGDPATRDSLKETPQEAGLVSLAGGRAHSVNVTVDGLDNNDDRLGRERARPGLEMIQEVQIITNHFAAEHGRASGGRINFRTRHGGNSFHSAAFYDFQDESLNANSFFRNARSQSRLPFQRRELGGRFGGPVRRNRLFFFGAFERRDEPDTDAILALLPVSSQANPSYVLDETPTGKPFERDGIQVARFEDDVSAPGEWSHFSGRVDANWRTNHDLFFRFDHTMTDRLRARNQGATLRSGLLNWQRNSNAFAVQDNWVLSATVINQARFQYSTLTPRHTQSDLRPGVIVGNASGLNFSTFGEFANGFIAGAGGFPETRDERRWQLADALSWTRGRHQMKFGADLMRLRSTTSQLGLYFGFYNFSNFGEFVESTPSRFRQRIGEPQQPITNDILGFFGQDEWRVRPSLMLSFGLRYDRETLGRDNNNLGPRLAFAWAPRGSDRTVLRGGFGVFYDRVLLRTFEDFAVESRLFEIDLGSFPGATGSLEALNRIGSFPNIFPNDPTNPLLSDVARPILDTRRISPDLQIPYSLQARFGIEREISKSLTVEVNYLFNRGVRLWRGRNINAPIPPPGGFIEFLLNPPANYPGVVVLPDGSTAFDNRSRQITNVSQGYVRFDLSDQRYRDIGRGTSGVRVFGINALPGSSATTNPIFAALNAVRYLRPSPALGEIEQLQSDGRAIYHGLDVRLTKRFGKEAYFDISYTFSKLIDDVTLTTHSPMDEFNYELERSLGLTDARHRFVLRGRVTLPRWIGRLEMSPLLTMVSGRPFNITTNGQDRNLTDTFTDRPHFIGTGPIRFVAPGDAANSEAMARLFVLPTIGASGTLGRNVGQGPANRWLNVQLARRFQLSDRLRLKPWVNVYNVFNTANFIMNGFYGPLDERQDQSVFLQPRAARKPRTIELGIRLEF
jgi:hypothetical protein